jgi:hypothetical protein
MNAKKIYMVVSETSQLIEEIYGIFDSKEKVEAFVSRFRDRLEYEIIEQVLNPEYLTCKDKNPYAVDFKKTGDEPFEVLNCACIPLDEDVAAGRTSIKDNRFTMFLLASSEEEAVTTARAKRDEIINKGEWN